MRLGIVSLLALLVAGALGTDGAGLVRAAPGTATLTVLSPEVLEVTLVTSVPEGATTLTTPLADAHGTPILPAAEALEVRANGARIGVAKLGMRQEVLYAPLRRWDLRLESTLTLGLEHGLAEGARMTFTSHDARLGVTGALEARFDPDRPSRALHVSEVGYDIDAPKLALVGAYLGTLGELPIEARSFSVVDADSGAVQFRGELRRRRDEGYEISPRPYQHVFEARFDALRRPGRYRLVVSGLGSSRVFGIGHDAFAALARAYALGLYHQRCGAALGLPYTRFVHGACHTRPATVPEAQNRSVRDRLGGMSANAARDDEHTAPRLDRMDASLYPILRRGPIDVAGGHHDAGDYGKYVVMSAQLVHHLVFAADSLGGAGALDNLGLPESGDGFGDLLEEAAREADFLAKMQDTDGGFFTLVQPRDRAYESDVLPDAGDAQVVFPKTTTATAAATAALAEIGSSPRLVAHDPERAAHYLASAQRGWQFLERAWKRYGRRGAYQLLHHYGAIFRDNDEIAWAAAALFGATGDKHYEAALEATLDPGSPETRRWTWWRLFEGYGCALRSYAFLARSGRLPKNALDASYLRAAERELEAGADDVLDAIDKSAYATPFPLASKRFRTAGWYFSSASAFDLLPAYALTGRRELLDAYVEAVGYETGANPNDVVFVSGLGRKRQSELVSQVAQNDREALPPSGLPVGNIREGFHLVGPYRSARTPLVVPDPKARRDAFAPYDLWSDSFDTSTEAVSATQARSLAGLAFLMARTKLASQPWRAAPATLERVVSAAKTTFTLRAAGLGLTGASVVWERESAAPGFGTDVLSLGSDADPSWVEAEATLPDGRRVFAVWERQQPAVEQARRRRP